MCHFTTEEARERGLPGSDVYKNTHLFYNDAVNRDYGVYYLNRQALKAFEDTITISKRHSIIREEGEMDEWLRRGGPVWVEQDGILIQNPDPETPSMREAQEYELLENLKIATGFEVHLKARLIARDYIVHEIDMKDPKFKSLAKEQKKRPIKKEEFFKTTKFHFDGQQNYLPGLKNSSISFSRIIEISEYINSLEIDNEQIMLIEYYRKLRNQIHFPGNIIYDNNFGANFHNKIEFLLRFINSKIIIETNKMIEKNRWRYKKFEILR